MIYRKHLLTAFCICFFTSLFAQEEHLDLPKLNYKEYGFQQPIMQSITAYYKADSGGYSPKMVEFLIFDKQHNISQRVLRILGKYRSETSYMYVYKNGLLDSLNVTASAASFSRTTNYIYNSKKQLIKSETKGKYASSTNEYSYNDNGQLSKIVFAYEKGGGYSTNFHYSNNQLDYVERIKKEADGTSEKLLFYYLNGTVLASTELGSDKVILYDNDFGELRREVKGDIVEIVKNYRSDVPGQKPNAKPFLKDAKTVFQTYDTKNMDGDWIKRYQVDQQYGQNQDRFVFRKIYYTEDKSSGDTKFSSLYEMQMKKRLNLK